MTIRALALSGGGARGSFQMGALAALYDVYGFRPDVIAGTSVGSVNGIKLALARPPAVNDPAAILASVAAGTVDSGLIALRALEAEWATFITIDDFFAVQPAFKGSMLEDLLETMNAAPTGEPPLSATLGPEIDKASVWLSIPLVSSITGPIAADVLQKLRDTILAVLSENSVFNLEPVSKRLNDPTKLTLADLAAGTPIYLAAVALESGRLRYIDGNGTFTERDGLTPVMSALMDSDIDAALDENLQPLDSSRRNRIKDVVARYRSVIGAIAAGGAAYKLAATTAPQRLAILRDIARNKERGNYLLDALHAQVRGLRLTTKVDPRRGVLASAAMPVFFDPIVIGTERYIDGGVREIIPMEIAVRNGVTDIVGICCSSLELPSTDDMSNAGLATVGLRALTEIALAEVTRSDIEAVRARGIMCTLIAPTFDVHGATVMNSSLIEISTDYGWMRACDEMQPAADADRTDFRRLSDLITTFRLRCYPLERYINENAWFLMAGGMREPVATLRTYRWIIRELLAKRTSMSLPAHSQARRWWAGWARELRPVGPFRTSSVWSQFSAFSDNGTEVRVADEIPNPDSYALDIGSLVDAANDRVYWIVRGATFLALAETEQTTTRTPSLVVPHGTMVGLPRIPRGSHLMAEQDSPSEVWFVRNEKRYRSTPGLISASGMTGHAVAVVPPGGLNQIPDGGSPYWLGGLYISDNQRTSIDLWDPTPQAAGSSSSTAVGLTNRSLRPVVVTGLTITSSQDGGGSTAFSVTSGLPLTVAPDTFDLVNALFHPLRPGTITGTVSVTCDDPDVPLFAVPLMTSAGAQVGHFAMVLVQPAGGSVLDLGSVDLGRTQVASITVRNDSTMNAMLDSYTFSSPDAATQIFVETGPIAKGQTRAYSVACSPSAAGPLTTDLTLHFTDGISPSRYSQDAVLMVTAVGVGARAEFTPAAVEFGAIAIGTESTPSTILLRNVGQKILTITGWSRHSEFRLIGTPPSSVAPGQTEQLSVVFRPGHDGDVTSVLSITSDSAPSPPPVELHGVGVTHSLLVATPDAVAFGAVPVGSQSPAQVVVVRNPGNTVVQLGAVSIVGVVSSDFRVIANTAGAALPREGTFEVQLAFAPTSVDGKEAALEVVHDGPSSPLRIWLSGQGREARGLVPNMIDLDFGRVAVGSSDHHRLVLTNADRAEARIENVVIGGAAAADFKIVRDECSKSALAPGASCSIVLSAGPSAGGLREARLEVNADVPATAVSLHVEGVAASATWSAARLDFGDMTVGVQAPRQDVYLHNAGNTPITVSLVEVVGGDFTFRDLVPTVMTIAPNQDKYFWLWFKPTAVGPRQSWLRVHSDAPGSPHSLELTGRA